MNHVFYNYDIKDRRTIIHNKDKTTINHSNNTNSDFSNKNNSKTKKKKKKWKKKRDNKINNSRQRTFNLLIVFFIVVRVSHNLVGNDAIVLRRPGIAVESQGSSDPSQSLTRADTKHTINSTIAQPTISSTQTTTNPKGVFVYKVHKLAHAFQSICTLTKFFNKNPNHQYPIVIFADLNYTLQELEFVQQLAGGNMHVHVVVDPTEPWRYFPSTLTENERKQALAECEEPPSATAHPKCTSIKFPIGYVYMNYWSYSLMGLEEALLSYDYFVFLDSDAFLTKPNMPDPFQIMADNNLTGIYNIEAYQWGPITEGIQQSAEAVFSLSERRSRYLNSPEYSWFDKKGKWGYGGRKKRNRGRTKWERPSVWTCFFGGRLDFFRDPRYLEFARRMAPHTYVHRVDEQAVISVAWALMAPNDKVWYLPQHDIHMGIMHHGWIDNTELTHSKEVPLTNDILRFTHNPIKFPYRANTLASWNKFAEYRDGPALYEYLQLEYSTDDPVQQCPSMTGKWG